MGGALNHQFIFQNFDPICFLSNAEVDALKAISKRLHNNFGNVFLLCGIFGYVTKRPLSMNKVFNALRRLEESKYRGEKLPVGGYGAGIAVLLDDNSIYSEKVGKTDGSPVCQLADLVLSKLQKAHVLVGHVRFPGLEFLDTAKFREAAQPFIANLEPMLTFVSAHNGRIENYLSLKKKLRAHTFESQKAGLLIDSEVVPHYYSALIEEGQEATEAADELLCTLKGKALGSIALIHLDNENAFLHVLHKGWSRGLTVWTNNKGEVIFCTRPEPVLAELGETITKGEFKEKAVIKPREVATLKLSFPITLK